MQSKRTWNRGRGVVSRTALVLIFTLAAGARGDGVELKTVAKVDVERYMGTWREVATIPASFQKFCAYGTTATYTLLEDGTVEVLNQCYDSEGELRKAKGRAWVVDPSTNAKLKVSFIPYVRIGALSGDYWIIDLGENYEYAVVGHPDRTYGWILARAPELPKETMAGIQKRLIDQGYDFSQFKMTPQEPPAAKPGA